MIDNRMRHRDEQFIAAEHGFPETLECLRIQFSTERPDHHQRRNATNAPTLPQTMLFGCCARRYDDQRDRRCGGLQDLLSGTTVTPAEFRRVRT